MSLFTTRLPSIQARISALVVACVLPAALAATLLLYHAFLMERANLERNTVDTAHAISQAIDRNLSGAEATLRVLSLSPYLQHDDLQTFYLQTEEIMKEVQGTAFVLYDSNGQQLLNTLVPYGSILPMHDDARHFKHVLNSDQPVISDSFFDALSQRPLIAVEFAVRHGSRVAYIISMEFFSTRFDEVLERQRLQKGQFISMLDSIGTVIAHTPQAEQFVGNKISRALLESMKTSAEGTVDANMPSDDPTTDVPLMIAYNRSSLSNWILTIGTPRAIINSALWESVSLILAGTVLLLALGLALAHIIGSQISRSIKGLVEPALALGHGKAVIVPALKLQEADDVGQVLLKASRLIQQRTVERDLATQAAQHIHEVKQKFEYQAYHDALTGLANRILFNQLIKDGIETCFSNGETLIVFFIDVDDFKHINDCHGHAVGDELLCLFANRLKSGLRESDVTARLGGDEFAAILRHTNLNQAEATAEALVDALSRPYLIGELTVSTSASIGVAGYPESGSTPESLLRQADKAMYQAKTNGKHRCVFDQSLDIGSAS